MTMKQGNRAGSGIEEWAGLLREHLGALPRDPGPRDLGQLVEHLTPLAWPLGSPAACVAGIEGRTGLNRRDLLATAPGTGHTALLVTWPPGHQAPLENHDARWRIEFVLEGALAIEEFADSGEPGRPMLAHRRTLILGIGDAAVFARPGHVQSCRNLSSRSTALSLHVYGGALATGAACAARPDGRTTTRAPAGIDAVLS